MAHYAGEKLRAADVDSFDSGLAAVGRDWTSYTPSWITTGAGADPTLGNGALTSRYITIGKTMRWQMILIWGSTTNGGAGDWEFGLPPGVVTQNNGMRNVGCALTLDSGIGYKDDVSYCDSNTAYVRGLAIATGGYYTATTPQTWAVNDFLSMEQCFEIV